MGKRYKLLSLVIFTCLLINLAQSEIHRATTVRGKSPSKSSYRYSEDQAPLRTDDYSRKLGYTSETWVYSIISAMLVGLSGIFPLLVIPLESGKALRHGAGAARLKLLLSFAVGGLLGDVFLHLLPEAWRHVSKVGDGGHLSIGLWVLAGLFTFLLVEKIFPDQKDGEDEDDNASDTEIPTSTILPKQTHHSNVHQRTTAKDKSVANGYIQNGKIQQNGKAHQGGKGNQNGKAHQNGKSHQKGKHQANGNIHENGAAHTNGKGHSNDSSSDKKSSQKEGFSHIKTSGWLNLMANVIDNFTHGLAVAGSYCAGTKSGLLTTAIILLHEIPHEVGDFAILLRSGFDRHAAAKAQILTASGGVLGAVVALGAESASSAGDTVAWILPFTSGGFLYIALVSVVPELLKEQNSRESFKQTVSLIAGIVAMALIALYLGDHDIMEDPEAT